MRAIAPVVRSVRQLSTGKSAQFTETANYPKGYQRIKEAQKRFQIDDGKPVHLKGGKMDEFLATATGFLLIYGVIQSFAYIYSATYPKK